MALQASYTLRSPMGRQNFCTHFPWHRLNCFRAGLEVTPAPALAPAPAPATAAEVTASTGGCGGLATLAALAAGSSLLLETFFT